MAAKLLGRIFLFAIFSMSLMLMTLSVAIFFSHVNWRDAVERLPEECEPGELPGYQFQLQQARKEKERLTEQITDLQKRVSASEKARDQVLAKLQTAVEAKDEELRSLKEDKKQNEQSLRELTAQVDAGRAQLAEAQDKVDKLVTQVAEQQKKVDTQVGRSAELSAQLAEAESFLAIAEERKKQLEQQLTNARLLLKQEGLDPDNLPRDLVPNLNGEVTAVVAGSIQVSLGSDDGLQAGHILEVYRGGEYVGRAIVKSVKSDSAVAEIVKDYARGIVQRGDRVTTRLKA